jgi:hypothetical protein
MRIEESHPVGMLEFFHRTHASMPEYRLGERFSRPYGTGPATIEPARR